MLTLILRDEKELHDYFFGDSPPHEAIFANTIMEIESSMCSGANRACIAEIFFKDDEFDAIIMECPENEWVDNLKSALGYYLSTENYEKCSDVRDLIQEVDSYLQTK